MQRYTSATGYTPPLKQTDEHLLAIKILQWAARQISPVSEDTFRRMRKVLPFAIMILRRRYAEEMDRLTGSRAFNDAFSFSMTAHGVRAYECRGKALIDLEKCESEKFQFLVGKRDPKTKNIKPTPILDMIHPRAFEAAATPKGMLMVKAENLRPNVRFVTRAALAKELKISLSTLYRRYKTKDIREACKRPAASPLPSVTLHPSLAEAGSPDRTHAKKTSSCHRGDD